MALAMAGAETLARHRIGAATGMAGARAPQAPARNPNDSPSWGKGRRKELSVRLSESVTEKVWHELVFE